MKQNIRKILAVLVLAMSVMGLTACGNTASTEPEINFDVNYLHSVADFLITNWDEMPAEEIAQYASMDAEDTEALLSRYGLPFTAEAFTTAFAGYEGSAEELGAYVSTDGYEEPVVKGDEITLVTNVTYENRTAKVSIVFNKKSVAQSVTIDPKYSTGRF